MVAGCGSLPEPIECDPVLAEDFAELGLEPGWYRDSEAEPGRGPCLRIDDAGKPASAMMFRAECLADVTEDPELFRSPGLATIAFGCESYAWPLGLETFNFDPKFGRTGARDTFVGMSRMLREFELSPLSAHFGYAVVRGKNKDKLLNSDVDVDLYIVSP